MWALIAFVFAVVIVLGVALTMALGRATRVWDGQLTQLEDQGELFKENQVLRCLELRAEGVPAALCDRVLTQAEVGG